MKSKKLYSLLQLLVVVVIITNVFSSCSGNKKKVEDNVEIESVKEDIKEYAYPLVSMFDITKMLNEIEASYMFGIANDIANAEKYFTEQSKAVNLGVYTADLAYAITYNQKNDVKAYFEVIEKLINDLDLTNAFSKSLKKDIEANLDNKEALVELVTKFSADAYAYLNKQGRAELSYLILSGSAIEGLHLTTHISENTFDNPKIIEAILYQKSALAKLDSLMNKYSESEITKSTLEDISAINEVYNMNESSTSMTVKQIEALKEILEGIRESSIQ